MSNLTCKSHNRRVMLVNWKVIHRNDGSLCDDRPNLVWNRIFMKRIDKSQKKLDFEVQKFNWELGTAAGDAIQKASEKLGRKLKNRRDNHTVWRTKR